jgi:hypothetical protein
MSNPTGDWSPDTGNPPSTKGVEPAGGKRELVSVAPSGEVTVFRQRLLADGTWYNMSARKPTDEELANLKQQQEPKPVIEENTADQAPAPIQSGSHNTHARLAPSASKQWVNCTGSIAYVEGNRHRIPADRGSKWADEGTEAHDWAAKLLTGACEQGDIPPDFAEPVIAYVEHCLSLAPKGVTPMVEVEVPLFYQPESKGTCDFAVLTDARVVVRDYKHGQGVLVKSEENTQLAIYALSLIRANDFLFSFGPDTEVDIAVFQPRHRDGHDQHPWVVSLADLERFCDDINYRATQAQVALDRAASKIEGFGTRDVSADEILEAAPGAKFAPQEGDDGACRWCPAKAFCERRAEHCTEPASPHFSDPAALIDALPDLTDEDEAATPEERVAKTVLGLGGKGPLTDETLVALYRSWKRIKAFYSDVVEYLERRAEEGRPAAGTKLVMGREGNREWVDEEAADKFLAGQKLKQHERYDFKLKSPAKVEKLLKDRLKASKRTAGRFAELITRGEAKPVLALDDDKREAVGGMVDALPDLTEGGFAL